jgi:alpha-tubulin suppressor-like RCC1 family protein
MRNVILFAGLFCTFVLAGWHPAAFAKPPLPNVQQISAGNYHICALTNGAVQCWGYNNAGQLGNGGFDSGMPTVVKGLESGVTAISSGGYHTCAIVSGIVKCWGYNVDGELGNGSVDNSNVPVTVQGVSGVVAIYAGQYHTCATTTSGSVRCWGWNANGQLGDGTNVATNTGTPTTVSGISSGVTMLTAGGYHTCALIGGAVKCWGANVDGELGNGSTADSHVPVSVAGLSAVTSIDAGLGHTCAIQTGGTVQCWGYNSNGQLGNNSTASTGAGAIVAVAGIASGATALASGGYHTCAIVGGAEKCWGDNEIGELGVGSFADSHVPVTINALSSGVTATTTGLFFSCAMATLNGTAQVKCWGDNVDGQLGLGDQIFQSLPVPVSGLGSGATALASSAYSQHACAIVNGGAQCWGDNFRGQLGDGITTDSSVPVPVTGLTSGVTAISNGSSHSCAVVSGKAMCWGSNANGQLGNGSTADSRVPLTAIASGVTAIGTGYAHSCAIVGAGVMCWGNNSSGELGDGSIAQSNVPAAVSGLNGSAVAISIGIAHTCVVLNSGEIQCWGYNSNGQLGNGTTTTTGINAPVTVSNISHATSIAAGGYHSCAVVNGGAMCWGDGRVGQLGNGLATDSLVPVAASGLASGVSRVFAGEMYTCAIANANSNGGTGYCWGDTYNIGNNSGTFQTVPAALALGNTVTSIGTSFAHGCAIVSGATLCVGADNFGELGDGRVIFLQAPGTVVQGDEIFRDNFDGH